MMSFKSLKSDARAALKKHYVLFVVLLLAAALLGTSFTGMLDIFKSRKDSEIGSTTFSILQAIEEGRIADAIDAATGNRTSIEGKSVKIGGLEIGHQEGVFSEIVNAYSSGSIFATIASIALNLTESVDFVRILFSVAALLIVSFKIVFISQTYKIIYTRMFLEGRVYERVDTSTLSYLIRTGKWFKVSLAYFRRNFFLALWGFTIVGGIIKAYSYAMVDYILAENPGASGKEAIELSKKMMDGHKWELFCLDVSFIGWNLLSTLTGGILLLFYVAPYKQTTKCEYFVRLRKEAIEKKLPGSELFIDNYVYEKAPIEDVDSAYQDIIAVMKSPDIDIPQPSKLRRFIQNAFGLVLWYDQKEQMYRDLMTRKADIDSYKYCIEGTEYPARMCPTKTEFNRISLEHTHYMRHYSVSSLVLIFFSFMLVGWLWEVSLHIIEDGVFVNRGVLHGPWLPIYGVGSLVILLLLASFRKTPWLEFVTAVVLCGGIEYFGSWMLEITHDGQKWWDYTGYFLNINGRICAEGLLVFGLAGIAAVYFIAPLLDNLFSKIQERYKILICAVLLSVFIVDLIYSHYNPNTGAGITDYGMVITEYVMRA